MVKKRVVVFETELHHHAELVSMMLSAHGLQNILLNKKDHAYTFGHIEVMVQPDHAIRAVKLIADEITF